MRKCDGQNGAATLDRMSQVLFFLLIDCLLHCKVWFPGCLSTVVHLRLTFSPHFSPFFTNDLTSSKSRTALSKEKVAAGFEPLDPQSRADSANKTLLTLALLKLGIGISRQEKCVALFTRASLGQQFQYLTTMLGRQKLHPCLSGRTKVWWRKKKDEKIIWTTREGLFAYNLYLKCELKNSSGQFHSAVSQVSYLSHHCGPPHYDFRAYLSRIKVPEPVKIPTAITSKKGISEQKEKSHLGDPTHLKRSELLPRGEAQQQSRAI